MPNDNEIKLMKALIIIEKDSNKEFNDAKEAYNKNENKFREPDWENNKSIYFANSLAKYVESNKDQCPKVLLDAYNKLSSENNLLDNCKKFANGEVVKVPSEQDKELLNSNRLELSTLSSELSKKPEVMLAILVESAQNASSDKGATVSTLEVAKFKIAADKIGAKFSLVDSDKDGSKDTAVFEVGGNRYTYGNLNIEDQKQR